MRVLPLPTNPSLVGMTEQQLVEALQDPHWRLRNLYFIKDKSGRTVLFDPNEAQELFLRDLWFRNAVPKARQRGFSTAVQLLMLDTCLWVPLTSGAVIAQDQPTAKRIRDGKIKFAYNRLPPIIREMVPLTVDNVTELQWENQSVMTISSSVRGGTIDFLHLSEYGVICLHNPSLADEIQEGSLPAVPESGIIVVESTVESPYGIFSDMVRRAISLAEAGAKLSRRDYRLHWASWWDASEYEMAPDDVIITPKDHAYFDRIEGEIGRPISHRKRAWYVTVRANDFSGSDEKMHRQYPSTLDEAFAVATDGLWLAEVLAQARLEKRITRVPLVASEPVNTFWDLGVNDNTVIWLHQQVGPRDHWVGYIEGSGEPPSYYYRKLQETREQRKFVWGKHFLPHDGANDHPGQQELVTYESMYAGLGLKDIEIVPRTDNVDAAIDGMRDDFNTYWFDEEFCGDGIRHLEQFSKVFNNRMQLFTGGIAKNGHQHAADGLRQKSQAQAAGLMRQSHLHSHYHRGTGKRRPRANAL